MREQVPVSHYRTAQQFALSEGLCGARRGWAWHAIAAKFREDEVPRFPELQGD
jgi:hypothetical protein